jgi:hypothetical protein
VQCHVLGPFWCISAASHNKEHTICNINQSHHLNHQLSKHTNRTGGNYRRADKSLARSTSRCILFGENISFDASLVIYINSSNIPPIIIINRIYEHQNLLSL